MIKFYYALLMIIWLVFISIVECKYENNLNPGDIATDECIGESDGENFCYKKSNKNKQEPESLHKKYLLYDVNTGEGFNLRRDVYMRVANLVKKLRAHHDWVLVLPPWTGIYHWFNRHLKQSRLKWANFFDLKSLNKFVPVIEFEEFIAETNNKWEIDQIFYLQNYKDPWQDGKWEEKYELAECIEKPAYYQDLTNKFRGSFWGFESKVKAKNFTCVSFQGMTNVMETLLHKNMHLQSIFIDRAEIMLHENYGQKDYWSCRRSMRFAANLIEEADKFREVYLNSNDVSDKTILDEDWTRMKRNHGYAFGGPYIGVHLRRRDFLYARPDNIPSIKYAAKTIKALLKKLKLETVFLSTDATSEEADELKIHLKDYKVFQYEPTEIQLEKYKDGGVAIIDQWICAHARYFIGTYESTFSFRIQEEREILGFQPNTTFNRLCSEQEKNNCEKSSQWTIVY